MSMTLALTYYRKNYLFGVARPGALMYDGVSLSLYANDLSQVWSAPLSAVQVKKGMGILTVKINGSKASILTAVGGTTSPGPSPQLRHFLTTGEGIANAPSVNAADIASVMNLGGVGVYAKGQKALRNFFSGLGVLN